MSHGPGINQRWILNSLERFPLVPLGGGSRAELTARLRAAKTLERSGKLDIIRLWDENHTRIVTYAVRAGHLLKDGTQAKCLSVERAQPCARSTFRGSLRTIAREVGVSVAQIRLDLQLAVVTPEPD